MEHEDEIIETDVDEEGMVDIEMEDGEEVEEEESIGNILEDE